MTGTGEPQRDVIAFLSDPKNHGGQPVERISTHISHIFLTGSRCYKLKREVDLGFLDFSTADKRRAMCEREVALNARTAPNLYVGVESITHQNGLLAINGGGAPVDWVVVMNAFDPAETLDRLALDGALEAAMIKDAADQLSAFHATAERRNDKGGAAGMQVALSSVEGMVNAIRDNAGQTKRLDLILDRVRNTIAEETRLLDARKRHGYVRLCHGDLHLGNICMFEGRPTLFDAIEFNDDIAAVDVLFDAAFTVMDLLHYGQSALACDFFNRYLAATRDYGALHLFPFYMTVRAVIRQAAQDLAESLGSAGTVAHPPHFDLIDALRIKQPARLVAIGGLSGTGKSHIARRLSTSLKSLMPGAVHLNSDVIRKRMLGKTPEQPLDQSAYTNVISDRVYGRMLTDARRALRSGYAVICDATFLDEGRRETVQALAAKLNVPFQGLWLTAPIDVLTQRVKARTNDPSDADTAVLMRQSETDPGPITWLRLDASRSIDEVSMDLPAALFQDV